MQPILFLRCATGLHTRNKGWDDRVGGNRTLSIHPMFGSGFDEISHLRRIMVELNAGKAYHSRKKTEEGFSMSLARIREFSLTTIFVIALAFVYAAPAFSQNECNFVGAPIATTGSITASDADQVGRLFRTITNTTTCQLMRTPTTSGTTALDFDQYTFTNDTGGPACVFVDLNAVGCGVANNQISMAAYLGSYNPASVLTNLIAEPGGSTGQNFATSMSFMVPAGATYVIVVHNVNAATTCPSYTFTRYISNNCRKAGFDAANDGNADLAVFRPSGGQANWITQPIGGAPTVTQFGSAGDIPVPADYYGDEATDLAVFRPSNGTWYTSTNPATNYDAKLWGTNGDIPVQGDYDRDGIVDLAVFRPSNSNWYILRSGSGTFHQFQYGITGDIPVVEDYDGDGRTDPATFRPGNGLWNVLQSSGNYGSTYIQMLWGVSTDKPVPADYDGDGKADVAVFRPSNGQWYIFRSSVAAGNQQIIPFGTTGDNPQPADYDGDRRIDLAVFRPSDGTWWIQRSTAGLLVSQFGTSGDIPASRPFWVP